MRARALAVATLVVLASTPAHADPPLRPERIPNKARQLAAKGRAAHTAGDYTTAVEAFKEAYVLAPSAGLLFNIAQAYRLAGNCDDAAWMYRRFLDTNPRDDERAVAEAQLAVVKKCGSGGLRVTLAKPRPDATKVPEPGVMVGLARPPIDDRADTYKRIGISTAAGGGALLAGAALFAFDAHEASDARGQRSATIATALGIGGGAAIVSGAVLYAIGRRFEHAHRMSVTPRAQGAQVTMTWDF